MSSLRAVPDTSDLDAARWQTRAALDAHQQVAHQRDVLAGLLVERFVDDAAGPYGGVDALDARAHQRLIDQARDQVHQLAVSAARSEELARLGRAVR